MLTHFDRLKVKVFYRACGFKSRLRHQLEFKEPKGSFFLIALALTTREYIGAYSSMVEQGTHNPLVLGSNPGGPTMQSRIGKFGLPILFICSFFPTHAFRFRFLYKLRKAVKGGEGHELPRAMRVACCKMIPIFC